MKPKFNTNKVRLMSLALLLSSVLVFTNTYGQIAINMNGNLPDSSAMLDVQATGMGLLVPRMTLENLPESPANGLIIYQLNDSPGFYYYDSLISNWEKIGIKSEDYWKGSDPDIYFDDAYVGIGTSEPQTNLHILGNIEVLRLESSNDPLFSFYENGIYKAWMQAFDNDFYITNRMNGRLRLRTSNVDRLVIESNGNVVIGATSGADGYRLSVNGKMACEEILIDDMAYWPDYVFNEDYTLLSIEDLEKSIQKNHHLPGVPSAKDIENQGGYHIGNTQKILLEKIEELSLYIIELNKRIKLLEEENHQIKDKQ